MDFSLEDESWLAGAQIGFDHQSGNWVFGIIGDVTWLDFEETEPLYLFPGEPAVGEFGVEIDWLATVRGRIGYAVDRFLFYGTAGIAFGDVDAAVGTTPFATASARVADVDPDDWAYYDADQNLHVGYAIGVGAAAKLTPNIEVEATYLYVDLGEETYDFSDAGTDLGSADIDVDLNIFRIGVNYRFSTW